MPVVNPGGISPESGTSGVVQESPLVRALPMADILIRLELADGADFTQSADLFAGEVDGRCKATTELLD